MFKKTIKYFDFNDVEHEEEFYFHMSKADLIEMAADGDLYQKLQRIIATKDNRAIFQEFKNLVRMGAGVRSADGKTFDKSPEAKAKLMDSAAFDELVLELCTNEDAAADFVKNLMPEKMLKETQQRLGLENAKPNVIDVRNPFGDPTEHEDPRPLWMRENRNPTQEELRGMSADELRLAFQHRK